VPGGSWLEILAVIAGLLGAAIVLASVRMRRRD
jgi:hypothetical protein